MLPRFRRLPLPFLLLSVVAVADGGIDINVLCRTPPPVNFSPGEEHGSEARKYQGIPGIERAPNGRLWAVWYAGKIHEDRYNYVVAATSGDDGRTWSDLKFVIDPDGDGPLRAFDPVPWLDPDGKLWLFWSQNGGGARSVVFAMTTENPGAENPVWSEPRFLHEGITMCKPIVASNGDWLLPTSVRRVENSVPVLVSTDRGETWTRRGAANIPEPKHRECDEPMMIERRDGSLWMLVRTTYGIGETVSTDVGRTWTPVAPSAIVHPTTRFYIRRLDSGNLLLVKHGPLTERTGRSQLMAFLSPDDGATWEGGLMLDERATVSYPDGASQGEDGTLRIIYDWNRADEKHILMAVFTEEDVRAGRPVSDHARFRVLVNEASGVNPKPWLKDGRFLRIKTHTDGAELLDGPPADLVPEGGEVRELNLGETIFSNRSYQFHAVPEPLLGRKFVHGSIDGTKAVCRQAGVVYVLTPVAERNRDSLEEALLEQGFAKAATREFLLFLMPGGTMSGGNVCSVFQKNVEAGETLELGKWGVLAY